MEDVPEVGIWALVHLLPDVGQPLLVHVFTMEVYASRSRPMLLQSLRYRWDALS